MLVSMLVEQPVVVEERLTKAIFMIVNHERYRWQAGVISNGDKFVIDDEEAVKIFGTAEGATACTNGRDEWYYRKFMEVLSDPEFRWIVLHENYHKILRDLACWPHLFKMHPVIAGMAADFVNNLILQDENREDKFAVMPVYKDGPYKGKPMGLVDEQYRGMDLEQVFWKLYKEHVEDGEGEGGDGEGEEEGDGEGGGGGLGRGPQRMLDKHDWEGYEEIDEEDKAQLDRDIEEGIRAGEQAVSKTGVGGQSATLKELLRTEHDWRTTLQEFLTQTCSGTDYSTWEKPHRMYLSSGYYLPSGVSERAKHLIMGPDVSGSCFNTWWLQKFYTHVLAIIKTLEVERTDIMFWDTEVHTPIETYTADQVDRIVDLTKPVGGGGTTPSCVPDYIKQEKLKPDAVIMLTDGDIWGNDWGDWNCPVIWVVPKAKKRIVAPVGTTIICDI